MKHILHTGCLFLFLSLYSLSSQSVRQIQKLAVEGSDRRIQNNCGRMSADQFGYALDMDSGFLAVGANFRDLDTLFPFSSNAGAVYIYQRAGNNWAPVQKITVPNPESDDRFGQSLSMRGDWLFASTPNHDLDSSGSNAISDAGAVYIFKRQNNIWSFYQKITAPARAVNDRFGHALEIGKGYAVVGVPNEDEDTVESNTLTSSGSAYIFKLVGGRWAFDKKITANIRASNHNFGHSVSIYDSTIAVGCVYNNTNAGNTASLSGAGSVHIFKKINGVWSQRQKIVASDRAASDQFGQSLSLDSNKLAVGSLKNNNTGRVYIFRDSANLFREKHKISPKDLGLADKFGYSVRLKKNRLLVGAPEEDHDTSGLNFVSTSGSAYFFRESGNQWAQVKKLVALKRNNNQYQGFSLDFNDSLIVTGAYGTFSNEEGLEPVPAGGPGAVNSYQINDLSITRTLVLKDYALTDQYGYAVDVSGNVLIVGAPYEDDDSAGKTPRYNSGAAYLYEKTGGRWQKVQKLQASDRRALDEFGNSVAISGNYAFVGARYSSLDTSGQDSAHTAGALYVFRKNGNRWVQIQKLCAFDRAAMDYFAFSISVDSNVMAVSSLLNSKDSAGGASVQYAGAVYIFKLNNGRWEFNQKLKAPDAAVNDYYGYSLDIKNGKLLVGAKYSGLDTAGANQINFAGSAYLYEMQNNLFVFKQKLCADQRLANAWFGTSLVIRGNLAVVGAGTDSRVGSVTGSGSVYIFRKNGNRYVQTNRLNAANAGTYYQFGAQLDYSDSVLYVSAKQENHITGNNNYSAAGIIYSYLDSGNNSWNLINKVTSNDIAADDFLGSSLAADSHYLVAGAPLEDHDSRGKLPLKEAGSVYVFELISCTADTQYVNAFACSAYISPSGLDTWTQSGTYYELIRRQGSCDSPFVVKLTIGNNMDTVYISSCSDFTSFSGKTIYSISGVYVDTLVNTKGCDSVITVNFRRKLRGHLDTSIITCEALTSPSGRLYDSSGIYKDTIVNYDGCDSIITINLTRLYSSSSDTTMRSCSPMQSPSGMWMNVSGIYFDTFTNAAGCDSFIRIAFFRLQPDIQNIFIQSCKPYISPGGKTLVSSGNYTDTLISYAGCDSIIAIQFKRLVPSSSQTDTTVCKSYKHNRSGKVYTASINISDTLSNYLSCDSIAITRITVILPAFSINQTGDSLYSNLRYGTVNWWLCDSNYGPSLASAYMFRPSMKGNYQAEINYLGCRDTSACIGFQPLTVANLITSQFNIYPNPATEELYIENGACGIGYRLLDAGGRCLLSGSSEEGRTEISLSTIAPGAYILRIECDGMVQFRQVIKQ